MLPLMVAGPLTTEYVTAPDELDVALTVNGAAPNVWVGTAANVSVGLRGHGKGGGSRRRCVIASRCLCGLQRDRSNAGKGDRVAADGRRAAA